ncbi:MULTISPECIES: cation:proton antiporter [unclassified Streptomyces]|uniref:cation:proton antiporter n=1 Tax=unclassified Streptomyces TaxID=2593676 RepID=UPI002E28CB3E|nr:monovalent cation/H(+) antiporter subunit G [Streptomyces sp. NBC_00223]
MDVRHVCALILLCCGAAALLLSALALLVLPTPYARLHALAPASSLGLPLVCLALALDAGAGRAAVKLLFIGALTAFCGPLTSIAIGRTMAYDADPHDGQADPDPAPARGEPPA